MKTALPRLLLPPSLAVMVTMASSCDRERREFRAPSEKTVIAVPIPSTSVPAGGGVHAPPEAPFEEEKNAHQVSEGKTLFDSFNCSTCHAQGGGDIGPPLMDAKWIYGSEPRQIHRSITEGRPNGMPAFGSHLTEVQTRQLVAYVRHLGGLVTGNASPGRGDHMQSAPPPNSATPQMPVNASQPARR